MRAGTCSCSACSPGTYFPDNTKNAPCGSCWSCPAGTYTANSGSKSCSTCPTSSSSSAGAATCTCSSGYTPSGSGDSLVCSPCSAGKYFSTTASSCQPCPTASSSTGATVTFTCTCFGGYVSSGSGDSLVCSYSSTNTCPISSTALKADHQLYPNLPSTEPPATLVFARGSYGTVDLGATQTNNLFFGSLIFKRLCNWCDANHQVIYYQRLSPMPSGFSIYSNMVNIWASASNILGTDFNLYSSWGNLVTGSSPWTSCNYDASGVGAFRDCGPNGFVGNQWYSQSQGTNQVAFYVLQGLTDSGTSQSPYPITAGSGVTYSGNSLQFDGSSNAWVSFGSGVTFGGSAFSISVWGKYSSFSQSWSRIFDFETAECSTSGLVATHSGSSSTLNLDIFVPYPGLTPGSVWTLNQFGHILFSCTPPGSCSFYFNGNLVQTYDVTMSTMTYSYVAGLGQSSCAGDGHLQGQVADFRLFFRALTSDEVYAIYSGHECQTSSCSTGQYFSMSISACGACPPSSSSSAGAYTCACFNGYTASGYGDGLLCSIPYPTVTPTTSPSMEPSSRPSMEPSGQPSSRPSMKPSSQPSMEPSSQPSMVPSDQPSSSPTASPTSSPTSAPSETQKVLSAGEVAAIVVTTVVATTAAVAATVAATATSAAAAASAAASATAAASSAAASASAASASAASGAASASASAGNC